MWHVQIDIDRPASEVWAVLADYGRDADWRREVTTMVPEPAGPARVGTRTHETGRMLGSPFETQGRVVEAGDHWFRWEARGDGSRACGEADHGLLCDEALHESVGMRFLEDIGKG